MRVSLRLSASWPLLLVCLSFCAVITAISDPDREKFIARFLDHRQPLKPLCLYTFDRIRPAIDASLVRSSLSSSSSMASDVGIEDDDEESLMVTIPPSFEEHVGRDCPFGDLQFDPELVTTLGVNGSTSLGIHLSEDPNNNRKRPHIASNEVIPAKQFMDWPTNGLSFEFSYRRRVAFNQTMTIFSIGSLYYSCGDPGIRLDLTRNHVLMLLYFFPTIRDDGHIRCNERRLFSAGTNPCVMPPYRQNIDDNPVVNVIFTFSLLTSRSSFFMKYVDPMTMETYECSSDFGMKHPDDPIEYNYLQGTYRLFIGNNPNNVTSPLQRAKIAAARAFRDPALESLSPEKRLRFLIKQKLNTLTGPRLPASFRGFGGKSISMHLFGIEFPPVNEDTPFRFIRDTISDFKKDHLDGIVDYIVKGLHQGNETEDSEFLALSNGSASQVQSGSSRSSRPYVFADANGSTFDIFHFAIFNVCATAGVIKTNVWNGMMTPIRPFIFVNQTVHALEDQELLIELLQLHSIFDDFRLEIEELPKLGKLLLYPSKTALTEDNLHLFRELPVEDQQKIYFLSNLHQNNQNLPRDGLRTFGRQFEPYAVFRYRVWKTTTGRHFNASHVATVAVFVDPVDSPPAALTAIVQVDIRKNGPTYLDLKGVDEAGFETPFFSSHRSLGLFDDFLKHGKPFDDLFGHDKPTEAPEVPRQNVKIVKFPQYGRLYDRKMKNTTGHMKTANTGDLSELEPFRIHREWIENRTFSTSLVYVFNREVINSTSGAVDELQYRLRVGKSESFSDIASIQLRLPTATEGVKVNETNSVAVVQLVEDSSVMVELSELEPMGSQLDSKVLYRVTQLPLHGKLYQYAETSNKSGDTNITAPGAVLQESGEIVTDVQGRLVYVPDPNYFNSAAGDDDDRFDEIDLDSLYFEVVDVQKHLLNSSAQANISEELLLQPRLIEFQVLNVPDNLVILPPTVFATTATRGKAVKVPVIFDDPDSFLGSYRVKLKADDDISEFHLGHKVTDNDVMRYCSSRTRPCRMIRSANSSFVSNERGDEDEAVDFQLAFVIESQTWDGAELKVEGSKKALQWALSELTYLDYNLFKWYFDPNHTAKFDVTIERVNSTFDAKAEMKYYIDYTPIFDGDGTMSAIERIITDFADITSLIYMGFSIAFVCFVISSASCCSLSFCCCCGRARERKRNEFNDARRRYEEQVVQNDYEYSTLLMAVTDVLLESDLQVSVILLQSCCDGVAKNTQRQSRRVLCIRSLLPLLDTESLGVKFVLRLFSMEVRADGANNVSTSPRVPSVASLAMVELCRMKGNSWLHSVTSTVASSELSQPESVAAYLLDELERELDKLPAEIVVLCRTYAAMSSSEGGRGLIDGIHTVFFNHFIGPKLWFLKRDASTRQRLSSSQRRTLRKALSLFVSSERTADCTRDKSSTRGDILLRYNRLLQRILTSPALPHAFDPRSDGGEDCELMAMCLMNIHSILDATLPALEEQLKTYEECVLTEPTDEIEELNDSPVDRVKRVLRALNFPLASAETMASSCEHVMASDPVLLNGFSSHEWEARFASVRNHPSHSRRGFVSHLHTRRPPPDLRHAESLLCVDVHIGDEEPTTAVFESTRSCDIDHQHHSASTEFEF